MAGVEAVALGVVGPAGGDGRHEPLHQLGGHLSVSIDLDQDFGAGLARMDHPSEDRPADAGVLVLAEHGDPIESHGLHVPAGPLGAGIVNHDDP